MKTKKEIETKKGIKIRQQIERGFMIAEKLNKAGENNADENLDTRNEESTIDQ